MKLSQILLIAAAFAAASSLPADVVETKNGARLVGKVSKIDGGTVTLSTSYAGDLSIKQSEVSSISTDEAIAVRLASGTRIDGKVSTEGGTLKVTGSDGTVSTSVDKVAATWSAGGEDPAVAAGRRTWTFVTATDVAGKSGNTKSTAVGVSFVAALSSPQDALKFYGSYNYGTTTSNKGVVTKSADDSKAGIDYTSFFHPSYGWYVRSELGRDSVAGIDLRSTTDFGGTMRLIKNDHQSLIGRLGLGYRFESFPVGSNSRGVVLSTGLAHNITLSKFATIATELQYLPSLNDFADFRFVHDTGMEVPISAGFWKLRVGLSNQYNSRPLGGRENMDTTYYTRLLLNWK
jgi:hypothetical protein